MQQEDSNLNVWLLVYDPEQGQFTTVNSSEEIKINRELIKAGKIEHAQKGHVLDYDDNLELLTARIPDIAESLNLQWSEEKFCWVENIHCNQIIISGRAACGKSILINMLKKQIETNGYDKSRVKFVEQLVVGKQKNPSIQFTHSLGMIDFVGLMRGEAGDIVGTTKAPKE